MLRAGMVTDNVGGFVPNRLGNLISGKALDREILNEIIAPADAIAHEMMSRWLVNMGDRVYSLAVLGE